MKWLQRLFWRKTIDDLAAEMKAGVRLEISRHEIDFAREYTRRRLPKGLVFPKNGEVFEAIADFKIQYMTSHRAPYTGGGVAVLPEGERVRVTNVSEEEPLGVYCEPLRYDELHEQIVPEEERKALRYVGYYFSISTVELNEHFRLVASGPA